MARGQAVQGMQAVHGLLFLGLMLVVALVPPIAHWPFATLVPVVVYTAVVLSFPSLRRSVSWLRVGRLDRGIVVATAITIMASSSALVLWYMAVRPDLGRFVSRIPPGGVLQLALIGLLFACVNAALEEAAWRGVVMDALAARIGASGAVFVQALGFGAGHLAGIPGGAVGIGMASLFGLALGLLRQRAQGMLPCFIVHLCADATIYILVVSASYSVVIGT